MSNVNNSILSTPESDINSEFCYQKSRLTNIVYSAISTNYENSEVNSIIAKNAELGCVMHIDDGEEGTYWELTVRTAGESKQGFIFKIERLLPKENKKSHTELLKFTYNTQATNVQRNYKNKDLKTYQQSELNVTEITALADLLQNGIVLQNDQASELLTQHYEQMNQEFNIDDSHNPSWRRLLASFLGKTAHSN